MKNKKRKKFIVLIAMALVVIVVLIQAERQPVSVVYSSVYSAGNQTEIQMYVLMNTFTDVDEEGLAEEIVFDHQKINGVRRNIVYTLKLYRTFFHYRRNWEYNTITCDENGAIICCGEDLGV